MINKFPRLFDDIRNLFNLLPLRLKAIIYCTPFFNLLGGGLELLTLVYISPLVQLASNSSSSISFAASSGYLPFLPFPKNLFEACLYFSITVILSSSFKIIISYSNSYIGKETGISMASAVIDRIFSMSLDSISRSGSSRLVGLSVISPSRIVTGLISPLLQLSTSVLVTVCLGFGVVQASGLEFPTILFALIVVYLTIYLFTKNSLSSLNLQIAKFQNASILKVSESITAIAEITVAHRQFREKQFFSESNDKLRQAEATLVFLSTYPKYIVESIALVLIAYSIFQNKDNPSFLSGAAVLFAGLIRVNQQVGQGFACVSAIKASSAILREFLDFIDVKNVLLYPLSSISGLGLEETARFDTHLEVNNASLFASSLVVDNLIYKYPGTNEFLFEGLSFSLPYSSKLLISGPSGCGKSTLLKLLMGLNYLDVNFGRISLGDLFEINPHFSLAQREFWFSKIAYVSQRPEILTSSIYENIAFPSDMSAFIDMDKVVHSSRLAQLDSWIESLPSAYETMVGESSLQMSGGQMQRIAIARALYKNPMYLFLDEFTSSLDVTNARAIQDIVFERFSNCTIIEVSHRVVDSSLYTHKLNFKAGFGWTFS